MSRTVVVADTLACLPGEMVERYGIEIIAPNICFDGVVYRDWFDLSPSQAYQMLEKAPHLFSTATPPPADLMECFRQLSARAENILYITISSKLSSFYNVAVLAKEQVKTELTRTSIEVLDSETVTGAEGFVVLAAARAAAEGKSLLDTIEAARNMKDKVSLIFVLETISYAYRTGRIPRVASQLGGLLSVKPLLTIRGGKVHFTGMTRSKTKGINNLLATMRRKAIGKPVHVAVHHTGVPEEAERLQKRILDEFDCPESWITEFSPVMSYSTGRGALGLAFYADDL